MEPEHENIPPTPTWSTTKLDLWWTADKDAQRLWKELSESAVEPADSRGIQTAFVRNATITLAKTEQNMDKFAAYKAAALSVRDRLIRQWNETNMFHTGVDPKRVYYLSMEFLLGRAMDNALLNMQLKNAFTEALAELGFRMEDIVEQEVDAALGNGGLGRLAACFMDSLATLDYPAWGYGLRYTYGIFKQKIVDGYQKEFPDYWLHFGNIFELPRLDVVYPVRFYGHVSPYNGSNPMRKVWEGGDIVQAVAYDVPIPGFGTKNTLNIRLWSSKPKQQFDLDRFNEGNYEQAVESQRNAENITSVLYPNDNHEVGKELRLKQEYFFVCATLQDVIRRFKKSNRPWYHLPDQVVVQLNDTHPALAIVELHRRLVDIEGLEWDESWDIVTRTFAYTNHTVLPEASEKWTVPLLSKLLPRHMSIIFEINLYFLQKVEKVFPGDREKLRAVSIIEEGNPQCVRMAMLAVVGSFCVNGVAAIHSELIKQTMFKEMVEFYGPEKFQNKTNGITPRRWLYLANAKCAKLISQYLGGNAWLTHLDQLTKLQDFADDGAFQKKWAEVKYHNKLRLSEYIFEQYGVEVSPDALFDIQVKRFHEYKRQLMNILGVISRYISLKKMSPKQREGMVPRVVIFGGKAAPGYYFAKLVIKLINNVANVVNTDEEICEWLKVIFLADYNVSLAELIIPASDLSQHISTAGTEASGTSNMKFALNGGLIIGTDDGANIEIKEEIGEDNMFIFGAKANEVDDIRYANSFRRFVMCEELESVLREIEKGTFGDPNLFAHIRNVLMTGDHYIVSHDFPSYLEAQDRVDAAFKNAEGWVRKSILSTARMGKFSSDRAIKEYAKDIWKIVPCKVPC